MINRFMGRVFFALSSILIIFLLSSNIYAQTPGSKTKKPRVAVLQASIGARVNEYVQRYLDRQTIMAEMESSLWATGKFELITRKEVNLEAIKQEQEFAQSNSTRTDASLQGTLENADYLVLPVIQDFKFYRLSKPVPNISDKYIRNDGGMLEITAQVLDAATGGIRATFYLKDSFYTPDKVVNSKGGAPSSVYFTRMAKNTAAQMADQLVDILFPMRVVNAEAGQVWINRGKDGGLKEGDILEVFAPGKDLVDPYTGEKLGTAERLAGKVKVKRVNPKFTIADILEKELNGTIQNGYILRKP